MALKDYGKAENDPGEWVDFGEDKPFRLRVRRIPGDVADEIDRRHLGKPQYEVKGGVKRPIHDIDGLVKALTDKAVWAWTDSEGLEIDIADEEAAKLWGKLLNRDVETGATVALQGNALTADAKRRVLAHLRPFARMRVTDSETGGHTEEHHDIGRFIVLEAARLQRQFADQRGELSGNS